MIALAAGSNLVLREAITRQLASLKDELAESSDVPLMRLLIERTALCWLECYYLDALAAQLRAQFGAPVQIEAIERRRDHAQRRFLAAIRSLASLRKLLRRSPAPIEIATHFAASKRATTSARSSDGPARAKERSAE